MRRILFLLAIGGAAVAAGAALFAAERARPGLIRSWAAALTADRDEPEEEAEPEVATRLEPDAPDDGWRGRLGPSAPEEVPASLPTIRLASPEVAGQIGLANARAEARAVVPKVVGNAEISHAIHDTAEVRPRVAGRIAKVYFDEGDTVRKGQILLDVDAAEVGSAKADYLSLLPLVELARRDHDRFTNLRRSGAASEKDELTSLAALRKAEADLLNARQRLLNLGYGEAELAEIARTRDTSSILKIAAPQDGTLVERHAVQGEAVEANTQLFIDTDLSHVWCWIDVYESDVVKVRRGQPVRFTIAGTEGPVFEGVVELVGYSVNPVTRTIRVRADLANPGGRLLANQYGRAEILVGAERAASVVPRSAVQSEGGQEFVFIPQPDGASFRTQRVATAPFDAPGVVEVTFGLQPGDPIVTSGSFLLKSELFRSSLAGD